MTHKFIFLFISSLLLIACADESPMEAVTRDINEAERQYEYEQARQKQEQIQEQHQSQSDQQNLSKTKVKKSL